uniref:Uncharacterized protein n=1 Tax=Tanacetum cinerariifolium TaxID=118510 RepID=A0A699HDA1_TANCI|nr:hypothetical protein [Tanacetum cinerariifolium]
MFDSCLKNIGHTHIPIPPPMLFEQLLDDFMNPHDVLEMDDLELDSESKDTPLVSPFLDFNEESDDEEVINKLNEYGNARNFYLLGDIREFIMNDMTDVVMGRPFRAVSQLEYDCIKGWISFTRIFDTYIFWMPRTIPRLKNFDWSKVPPILELIQQDLMGALRVITPLFENMLVPATQEVGQAQDDVSIPTEPSTSKPHKKHKSKKQQPIAPKVPSLEPSPEHQLPLSSNDPIPTANYSLKLQELMDLCTRLPNKVLDLESEVINIKSSFTEKIEKLKDRVHKMIEDIDEDLEVNLEEAQAKAYNLDLQHSKKVLSMHDIDEEEPAKVKEVLKVVTAAKLITEVVTTAQPTTTVAQVPKVSARRRRKGVVIQDPKETAASVILEAESNANINWNDVIEQVKRSKRQNNAVMRYQALNRKPLTETQARKNMMIYLNNMAGFKMNFFKRMTYSEIKSLFEKHYNSNQAFLEKVKENVTVQEKEIEEEGNKRQGKSLQEEIAKKQRMGKDAEELKRHMQIMSNDDDDDVYKKATPLASKVPVVDYQIHHENNKSYYKIIRADESHKLFLSVITILKNFDREDLETLWKLVNERFETTEPKNFSDDFLLNILKIMFEKPNIEANMFLLVGKKYPLSHFTLKQMLNTVRLEVKEESEMSLELLRLVKRLLNEGYVPE